MAPGGEVEASRVEGWEDAAESSGVGRGVELAVASTPPSVARAVTESGEVAGVRRLSTVDR